MVWGPTFRRNLKDHEETQFIALLNSLNCLLIHFNRTDARVWIASKNGSFSVSFFFKAILSNPREKSGLYGVWKLKAPPRVLVFWWLSLRLRIPTIDLLRRRGMMIVSGCPMCLRDKEFVNHHLLTCKSAHASWMSIIHKFGFC